MAPAGFIFVVAVLQVENGKAFIWVFVVIRRRIDEAAAVRIGGFAKEIDFPHLAVRNIFERIKILIRRRNINVTAPRPGASGSR